MDLWIFWPLHKDLMSVWVWSNASHVTPLRGGLTRERIKPCSCSGGNAWTAWRRRRSRLAHLFIKLAPWITEGYKTAAHATYASWRRSWITETLSLIFSVLALAGLVATLSAHRSKLLAKWPQIITFNFVLSLFSLLMRTGVSVVFAEGILHCS